MQSDGILKTSLISLMLLKKATLKVSDSLINCSKREQFP